LKTNKAVKALIQKDDKFLLVKRGPGFRGGEWEIPGGRLNTGEAREIGLLREIEEETGLKVEIVKHVNDWKFEIKAGILLDGSTFLCKYLNGDVRLSAEHSDYKWVTKQDALKMNIPSWLSDTMKMME